MTGQIVLSEICSQFKIHFPTGAYDSEFQRFAFCLTSTW